jgi:hypothetical protein
LSVRFPCRLRNTSFSSSSALHRDAFRGCKLLAEFVLREFTGKDGLTKDRGEPPQPRIYHSQTPRTPWHRKYDSDMISG